MAERRGHRGYIGARPYRGRSAPQRVQNLVVRDYCARHRYEYLLSSVEYAFESSYLMLENVLSELDRVEGVVMYSAFMLPRDPERRADVYARVLAAGASLHGACEDVAVRSEADAAWLEDVLRVDELAAETERDGSWKKSIS